MSGSYPQPHLECATTVILRQAQRQLHSNDVHTPCSSWAVFPRDASSVNLMTVLVVVATLQRFWGPRTSGRFVAQSSSVRAAAQARNCVSVRLDGNATRRAGAGPPTCNGVGPYSPLVWPKLL